MHRTLWLIPVLLLVGGCFDTSPVAPEVAPVEVVARGQASTGGERCTLNRDQVAPGVHQFLIVADGADAIIRVTDPQGAKVLESEADAGRGGSGTVDMVEGEYVVECAWPAGGRERVTLTVVGR